ncbi:hypothetical protein WN943_025902 [Citrus x changshan-huyou]
MTARASSDIHFQVKDKSYYPARRFIVDLVSRSCNCGHWELSGLPCAHAMATISHARHTTEEYLPKYFTKQTYLNTYIVMFKLIPDNVTWDPCDRPKLSPPEITKKIGRPKKSMKRAATEPAVSCPDEMFTNNSTVRGGGRGMTFRGRGRGSRVRRGRYEADNLSSNPTQGSQASPIIDGCCVDYDCDAAGADEMPKTELVTFSRSTFSRWNLVVATACQSSPLLVLHESYLPLLLVAEPPSPLPPAAATVTYCQMLLLSRCSRAAIICRCCCEVFPLIPLLEFVDIKLA